MRGGTFIFRDVSFEIHAGGALLATGPNGSGKSSLLRLVAGLLPVAGGRLALDGGAPDCGIGEQAHYLGHADALKPSLTVRENLRFWVRFLGSGACAEAAALDATGIAHVADLPAGYLSAGQRRRLSIARLLCVPRPIWLLDEPTAPLDAAGQADVGGLMQRHLADGGMIVAATHTPLPLPGAQELRLAARAPRP